MQSFRSIRNNCMIELYECVFIPYYNQATFINRYQLLFKNIKTYDSLSCQHGVLEDTQQISIPLTLLMYKKSSSKMFRLPFPATGEVSYVEVNVSSFKVLQGFLESTKVSIQIRTQSLYSISKCIYFQIYFGNSIKQSIFLEFISQKLLTIMCLMIAHRIFAAFQYFQLFMMCIYLNEHNIYKNIDKKQKSFKEQQHYQIMLKQYLDSLKSQIGYINIVYKIYFYYYQQKYFQLNLILLHELLVNSINLMNSKEQYFRNSRRSLQPLIKPLQTQPSSIGLNSTFTGCDFNDQILCSNSSPSSHHEFYGLKANSFINNRKFIDQPAVIATMLDHIKVQTKKESICEPRKQTNKPSLKHDNNKNNKNTSNCKKQKIGWNPCKTLYESKFTGLSSPELLHQQVKNKVGRQINKWHKTCISDKKTVFPILQDRKKIIQLAEWMESKLQQFHKASEITLDDILTYKQSILNYGLSRIIKNVEKNCKEEGQLLRTIWNHTFSIFECILGSLADFTICQEKENITENQQAQAIFKQNLDYLRKQNENLKAQNQMIFDKMKSVIIWNRQLRKDRYKQNVDIKMLKFKNDIHSEHLERMIEMLLSHSPSTSCISQAKTILTTIANSRRNTQKIKGQYGKAIEENYEDSRKVVIKWLKRHSLQEDLDSFVRFKEVKMTDQQFIMMEDMDDKKNINNVNIHDLIKTITVSTQTEKNMQHKQTQIQKTEIKDASIGTNNIYKIDKGIQISQTSTQEIIKPDHRIQNKNNTRIVPKKKNQKINIQRSKSRKKNNRMNTFVSMLSKNSQINILSNENQDHQMSFERQAKETVDNNSNQYPEYDDLFDMSQLGTKYGANTSGMNDLGNAYSKISQEDHEPSRYIESYLLGKSKKQVKFDINSIKGYQQQNQDQFQIRDSEINNFKAFRNQLTKNNKQQTFKNNVIIRKSGRRSSLNFTFEQQKDDGLRQLQRSKFSQFYNTIIQQLPQTRDSLKRKIFRRRSFYKNNQQISYFNQAEAQQQGEFKSKMASIYKKYNSNSRIDKKNLFTSLIEQIVQKINKKTVIGNNLAKSKVLSTNNHIFQALVNSVLQAPKAPAPKNKQFLNSSLNNLNKIFMHFFEDYLRQLKRQRDQIPNECEKIYYPLRALLVEGMNHKYGLKDITQKKLKNFIDKVHSYAEFSERMELYSKLLGIQNGQTSADELLIYLKCLIYFDSKQNLQITSKQQFFGRVLVDHSTFQQFHIKICESFFSPLCIQKIKVKLRQQFKKNGNSLSIQKISLSLIEQMLKRKQEAFKKYQNLHQICSNGNFFCLLYTILIIIKKYNYYVNTKNRVFLKYSIDKYMKQFMKRTDILDEIYGKAVSQQRFIICCDMLQMPSSESIMNFLLKIKEKIVGTQFMEKYSLGNMTILKKLAKKYLVVLQDTKIDNSQKWLIHVTRVLIASLQANLSDCLGILGTVSIENILEE